MKDIKWYSASLIFNSNRHLAGNKKRDCLTTKYYPTKMSTFLCVSNKIKTRRKRKNRNSNGMNVHGL